MGSLQHVLGGDAPQVIVLNLLPDPILGAQWEDGDPALPACKLLALVEPEHWVGWREGAGVGRGGQTASAIGCTPLDQGLIRILAWSH